MTTYYSNQSGKPSYAWQLSGTAGTDAATSASLATHIDSASIHFSQSQIDHTVVQGVGTNTHAQIDLHIASSSLHFSQSQIDHGNLAGRGDDDHTQYHTDSRADTWFTGKDLANLGTKSHTSLSDKGTNTHAQIDSHVADSTIHFTQAQVDHNVLQNLTVGDVHTQYFLTNGTKSVTSCLVVSGSIDEPQLIVHANATQALSNPLISLRKSSGEKINSFHSNDSRNTFIGIGSGVSINGAVNVVSIGSGSAASTTTGSDNISIGTYAMRYNLTGSDNVCVGNNAGHGTSGYSYNNNTFIGQRSGLSVTYGHGNVGVGFNTFLNLTTGVSNVAIGQYAFNNRAAGAYGVAIGYAAGISNIGAHSIFIGTYAGYGTAGASAPNIVSIGGYSGQSLTTGGNNVFLGYKAGNLVSNGYNNILIGYQSGDNLTSGNTNIIIGHDINASAAGVTNEINIGNAIVGNTSTSDLSLNANIAVSGNLDITGQITNYVSSSETPVKNDHIIYNGTKWTFAPDGTTYTFSIATFTDTGGAAVVEIGVGTWKAVGAISFEATYNNGPAADGVVYLAEWGASKLTLTNGYQGPTTNTIAVTYPAVGSSRNFQLQANDGVDSDIDNNSYYFYNYRRWGTDTKNSGFTEADVESLASSELSNSRVKTFTVTAGVGEYIVYSYPSRLGSATFTIGGFEGGFNPPETVSITNSKGYTENYYVYASTNSGLGETTVVVT